MRVRAVQLPMAVPLERQSLSQRPQPARCLMQPPMQPPMGTGQGAQMRPPVTKQGTSRAVPVVVSAGLAIGVFCGLLFGLGVDTEVAEAATTDSTTVTTAPKKPDNEVAAPFQPERKDVKVPPLAPQVVKKDGTTAPAAGSGDPKTVTASGTGSAETPAAPAKPTKVNGTLKIDVQPEGALKVAKVSIDGKEIEGMSFELDMTEMYKDATKDLKDAAKKPEVKKEIKVLVKASGFKDFTSKVDVIAERDTTLKVEMQKKSTCNVGGLQRPPPPGGNTRPPPPAGGKKCPKPPCGLIDI